MTPAFGLSCREMTKLNMHDNWIWGGSVVRFFVLIKVKQWNITVIIAKKYMFSFIYVTCKFITLQIYKQKTNVHVQKELIVRKIMSQSKKTNSKQV